MSGVLVIQFLGWCLVRVPTDPDPYDEPRGVSGYTFAFAGEPDLDGIIHLQPPSSFVPRSHTNPIGVSVSSAMGPSGSEVPELKGARVSLLQRPKFENRNWILTPPGHEPIVPFHLRIAGEGIRIERTAPLDPSKPELDQMPWKAPRDRLEAHGGHGIEFEPATVGRATGIWDSLQIATQRLEKLKQEWDGLSNAPDANRDKLAALQGRIHELCIGITHPKDRRIMARYVVERFAFLMEGDNPVVEGEDILGYGLDKKASWPINFWMGAWDPDALCAFMEGAINIPVTP